MTHTITNYANGLLKIRDGTIDLLNDTIKVSLHTSAYTPNQETHSTTSDLTNELAGSGNYTVGGNIVANTVNALDITNDRITTDGDDVTFSALTPSAAFTYGVIYSDTTNDLIAYITFDAAQDPAGSDYKIVWATAANGAIVYVGY